VFRNTALYYYNHAALVGTANDVIDVGLHLRPPLPPHCLVLVPQTGLQAHYPHPPSLALSPPIRCSDGNNVTTHICRPVDVLCSTCCKSQLPLHSPARIPLAHSLVPHALPLLPPSQRTMPHSFCLLHLPLSVAPSPVILSPSQPHHADHCEQLSLTFSHSLSLLVSHLLSFSPNGTSPSACNIGSKDINSSDQPSNPSETVRSAVTKCMLLNNPCLLPVFTPMPFFPLDPQHNTRLARLPAQDVVQVFPTL